ncbi:MarR family winged helix-turn-helix transcriptional regulator [Jannaschia sp. 2305UL9-9]|uniref:MarR family winged helix-turn-helix transcriptional regulator n=1 Tax=Jannaschia sp. 2305UL9-9 TaxID=3121638 RepID=UPI003527BC5B
MSHPSDFDLSRFTPYLLNLAAENTGKSFQRTYRDRYGMLRTEWRVLFHLGRYGPMRARDICDRAQVHKTKVSRAVAALSDKRFLTRTTRDDDRREAMLSLTKAGEAAFRDLIGAAWQFDQDLLAPFSPQERRILIACLTRLAGRSDDVDAI